MKKGRWSLCVPSPWDARRPTIDGVPRPFVCLVRKLMVYLHKQPCDRCMQGN